MISYIVRGRQMIVFRVVTAHGFRDLFCPSEELLVEQVLKIHGIPYNAVCAYKVFQDGNVEVLPFLGKTVQQLLADLGEEELIFRTDRNIDYNSLLDRRRNIYSKVDDQIVAEYIFDNHKGKNKEHVFFSKEECRSFVSLEVSKFKDNFFSFYSGEKVIVGVSGGGDSNTLLQSLIEVGIPKDSLVPVMMLGIPDWDTGVSRAQKLCTDIGLELHLVHSNEVGQLLGVTETDWAGNFRKAYPESDLEVIGTLAVRLALSHVARKLETNLVVVGLNLEDLLAESFYNIMRGKNISPFPVREVDAIRICYPLYRCPKRILDGCYPKYALENYLARDRSHIYWRAVSYYLSQSMSTILPGIEFMLIDGLQKMSTRNAFECKFYEKLGFSAEPHLTTEEITKWLNALSGNKKSVA